MSNLAERLVVAPLTPEPPVEGAFTRRLSELEAGAAGFVCGSAESALALAIWGAAGAGGRVLYHVDIAPRTLAWFERASAVLGIHAEPVSAHDPAKVAEGLSRGARAVFVQHVAHESARELDVRALAWHCRSFAAQLCVDGTHTPGPLRTPLKLGADLVLQHDLRWLVADAGAREASLVVREPALAAKLRSLGDAMGVLQHDPARELRLAEGLASLPVRSDYTQRGARQLIERLSALGPGVRIGYPGVGNGLVIAFGGGHASERVYQHLPSHRRGPGTAGTSQLSPCGTDSSGGRTNSLRLQLGLDALDTLWSELSSAIAQVPEALVAQGRPAP